MDGGLFSSASSLQGYAYTVAASCTGEERVSCQQPGESKDEVRAVMAEHTGATTAPR